MIGIASALLLAAAGTSVPSPAPPPVIRYSQLTIQERVIIRVPARPVPPQTRWKEKKGPPCVPIAGLAGAAFIEEGSIDLILRGGQRLRAEFASSCPALDYYSGFYMRPTEDGQICANRDVIRTRSGGECEIKRFRKLVPDR